MNYKRINLFDPTANNYSFFFTKNKWYSFIQIDNTLMQYKSKVAKNKKDKYANKLTVPILIA
jgi:hypothetical protein